VNFLNVNITPQKNTKLGNYPLYDELNLFCDINDFYRQRLTESSLLLEEISGSTDLRIPPDETIPPPEISNKSSNRICLALIDETSNTSQGAYNTNYRTFRTLWPERELWVLRVGLSTPFTIPDIWLSNPLDYGPIVVNRDNGNPALLSDWFAIANLNRIQPGGKVGLFIDNSGSMQTASVQASYNRFMEQVLDRGLGIITVENTNEDYITPFITMNE
jgi:hypothetical protein